MAPATAPRIRVEHGVPASGVVRHEGVGRDDRAGDRRLPPGIGAMDQLSRREVDLPGSERLAEEDLNRAEVGDVHAGGGRAEREV